ncbi:MAG: carbohydrate-binding domain-containing protein [Clostridiales bacterium]|nr:carbohydrate-binding domain-containing protein [Clostridiales bacterium]
MKKNSRLQKALVTLFTVFLLTLTLSIPSFAASKTVATIGSKSYTSLENALKKVKNGQTITLKSNVTLNGTNLEISRGKKFSLNLNGKKITFKNDCIIEIKSGTVTLYGGSTSGNGGIVVAPDASLTVKDGTYKSPIFNYGKLKINGGTFKCNLKDYTYTTIANGGTGTLTINGGTFTNSTTVDLVNNFGSGKTTINGGTFKATATGDDMICNFENGEMIINDGTFIQTKRTILCTAEEAVTVINGGTFKAGSFCVWSEENCKASVTINGGTFSTYGNGKSDDTPQTLCNGGIMKITGGTIKTNKSQSDSVAIQNSGTLTVSGSAKISNQANSARAVSTSEGSTFKLKGGTITNSKGTAIEVGGKLTMTGGTVKGLIWVDSTGTATIKKGTLSVSNSSAIQVSPSGKASIASSVTVMGLNGNSKIEYLAD